jgi:hypothetical protein
MGAMPRIADIATNQTLAAANHNQIRNVNPKLFAKSGKPKFGKGIRRPSN